MRHLPKLVFYFYAPLTHFIPLISFDTPRNQEVFWCFQRVSKEISSIKWVKTSQNLWWFWWWCETKWFQYQSRHHDDDHNINCVTEVTLLWCPVLSFLVNQILLLYLGWLKEDVLLCDRNCLYLGNYYLW